MEKPTNGQYHWLNVHTDTQGTSSFDAFAYPLSELEKLRLVNEWNRRDPARWVYWID